MYSFKRKSFRKLDWVFKELFISTQILFLCLCPQEVLNIFVSYLTLVANKSPAVFVYENVPLNSSTTVFVFLDFLL